jgi:hypothetical protein
MKKSKIENRQDLINRNKCSLIAIEGFLLGFLGIDRLYMGCYLTGLIKMGFFFVFVGLLVAYIITDKNEIFIASLIPLAVSFAWALWDANAVFVNSAIKSETAPSGFCFSTLKKFPWSSTTDIESAQYLGIAVYIIFFLLLVVIIFFSVPNV